ncbi:short chain dehydrogenase [Pseudomonas sp. TWP3-1]|uniref:short chain dehydrogenase n=1 Tax=unclassified Pseudomonas TaxID=196821 RepID=UPI003CEF82D3
MIAPSTGMKSGERYTVESIERARHFPGFFLDGKYYLSPELLTAVGWLEGNRFLYDELDPSGEPVFPGRVAGVIEDLTLTLADGARLPLNQMPYEAQDSMLADTLSPPLDYEQLPPAPAMPRPSARMLLTGAALLLGTYLLATRSRRQR